MSLTDSFIFLRCLHFIYSQHSVHEHEHCSVVDPNNHKSGAVEKCARTSMYIDCGVSMHVPYLLYNFLPSSPFPTPPNKCFRIYLYVFSSEVILWEPKIILQNYLYYA